MGKSSVIIIYATLSLLLFVLLASLFSPTNPHHRHRHHRRLILRPNSSAPGDRHHHHPPIPFDPIISDIEIHREEKHWEREHFSFPHHDGKGEEEAQPEWDDFMDAEDYINDDERFNITNRIVLLFPKIDVSPSDGFVSSDELIEWNLQQAMRETLHRTQRDMELHDKNHDGFISFQEYEGPTWDDRISSGNDMGWWKEDHFNASDVDGDGLLSLTEFNDFLHPADSNNPKLIQWLCKDEMRERDKDNDGKLSFEEYFHGLFDAVRDYDVIYNHSDSSVEEESAKKLFVQLDQDNDGFLSDDELKVVIGILHPSERYYAKQQADYAISQADSDTDGHLSLAEMIEHPYVFYSTVFSEEEDEDFHDEFR